MIDGLAWPFENDRISGLGLISAFDLDTDFDGIGNACDAYLNDDCLVNFGDLALLKAVF